MPRQPGTTGQVLYGVFDMGGQAVVGTTLGGPGRRCCGGNFSTGFSEFERLTAQGVDFRTAQEAGLVQGGHCWCRSTDPHEPRVTCWWCAGGRCGGSALRGQVKVQCDAPQQQQYVQRQILPMPQVQILRSVWHSAGLLQKRFVMVAIAKWLTSMMCLDRQGNCY